MQRSRVTRSPSTTSACPIASGAGRRRTTRRPPSGFAQYNLGLSYRLGRGTKKDDKEATKWFLKAARQDNARAQFNVGHSFARGLGAPRDLAVAAQW